MLSTIIIGGIFLILIFFAGRHVLRNMKAGKCTGCSECGTSQSESGCSCCHDAQKKDEPNK
ncbi:FeoB-associated Cys-rich membrane protein [Aminipila sp.]|jgi:hypothetical protein|uniref:FeoB-associated Cys-rich membrane protein n=1 Tax=Aminipila sp. TaxID=2060095 RepID=UPI001D852045|nr:FeoB-associated Cys-rich membrane protein [Aminipila sp.]MBE6033092.1 FeoB-associated Cys-rich membrane protein [Clostridiales bacterium]